MRVKWRPDFPPVFVHGPWHPPNGLKAHPRYEAAKEKRDLDAAREIIADFVNPDFLDDIFNLCYHAGVDPIVVAPVSDPDASTNALAASFAAFLAKELEFALCDNILQLGSSGRDLIRDGWFRLTHEPAFEGEVAKGRHYIIADDVLTLGGTLAALHGFINDQDGHVICMTTLAGTPPGRNGIPIDPLTVLALSKAIDGRLPGMVEKELGYEIDCLTEREAQFLLAACQTADDFYEGIAQGRGQAPVE